MPRKYDLEFKLEAVRMAAELRVTNRAVERRLGIGQGVLSRWKLELKEDGTQLCQSTNGSGHREPAVHEKILCTDTGRKYPFDHGFQMPSGSDRSLFSSLMRTAAFVQIFLAVAQTLFRIGGGEQRKIQRQATDTVGPAYAEHPKAFQLAPVTVIIDTAEQLHQLGPRAVARAVIDNEYRLSIFVREVVAKAM